MSSVSKLAVLDFDSTILNGESLDDICRHFLTEQDFGDILKLAEDSRTIADEKTFYRALTDRVEALRGIRYTELKEFCEQEMKKYHKGAKELVSGLRALGYKVVIFSGGFRVATGIAKKELGIDEDFANDFIVNSKGRLTGEASGPMMLLRSKGDMIQQIQNVMDVSPENTLVVGDSTNDMSMYPYAKYSVAFCAKPIVREKASIIIDEPDLSLILNNI